MKITKHHKHDHFWIDDGVLYETYRTIRGLRYRAITEVNLPDNVDVSDEIISELNFETKCNNCGWKGLESDLSVDYYDSHTMANPVATNCPNCDNDLSQ